MRFLSLIAPSGIDVAPAHCRTLRLECSNSQDVPALKGNTALPIDGSWQSRRIGYCFFPGERVASVAVAIVDTAASFQYSWSPRR
jgi:hypothetical protein